MELFMYIFCLLNAVSQSPSNAIQCQGVLQGFSSGRESTKVGSWSTAFPYWVSSCGLLTCRCYNVPIAGLTHPPFTELIVVLSLIWVWEIFLSCDKKACLWFAGESLGTVAMTSCCKKNGAILSSAAPNHVHQRWKCQGSPRKLWPSVPLIGFPERKQQNKGF